MAKKETKQIVIGEVPADLYDAVISGAAKQLRKQLKAQAQNREIVFDDKQSDEDFVKKALMGTLTNAYKTNEAVIASQAAGQKRRKEIDGLLGVTE